MNPELYFFKAEEEFSFLSNRFSGEMGFKGFVQHVHNVV